MLILQPFLLLSWIMIKMRALWNMVTKHSNALVNEHVLFFGFRKSVCCFMFCPAERFMSDGWTCVDTTNTRAERPGFSHRNRKYLKEGTLDASTGWAQPLMCKEEGRIRSAEQETSLALLQILISEWPLWRENVAGSLRSTQSIVGLKISSYAGSSV